MEFISEFSNTSAVDVISFIKEVVEKFPSLRAAVLDQLLGTLADIKAKKIFRGALWILGEYCTEEKDIKDALRGIRNSVGELPILDTEKRALEAKGAEEGAETNGSEAVSATAGASSRRILADGTYATESALTDTNTAAKLESAKGSSKPPLRCNNPAQPKPPTPTVDCRLTCSPHFGGRLLPCSHSLLNPSKTRHEILRTPQHRGPLKLIPRRSHVDHVLHSPRRPVSIRQDQNRRRFRGPDHVLFPCLGGVPPNQGY